MATLKVRIKENMMLDNYFHDSVNTLTIDSIDEIYQRTVDCAASQTTTIAVFNNTSYGAAGAIDIQDSKYIRITNKDLTNSIEIAIVGNSSTEGLYQIKLDAGYSHIIMGADNIILCEEDTSPSFATLGDLSSIQVNPGSNQVKVEIFIASA
tara:strand:- start:3498 stop:3953 length:456 start_codon:yes stop_codon:yes gene_type:complete